MWWYNPQKINRYQRVRSKTLVTPVIVSIKNLPLKDNHHNEQKQKHHGEGGAFEDVFECSISSPYSTYSHLKGYVSKKQHGNFINTTDIEKEK